VAFRQPGWPERGVDLRVPASQTVAPRSTVTLWAMLSLAPQTGLDGWNALSADGGYDETALGAAEADGAITLTPVGADGQASADWPARIPFFTLARAASDVQVTERTTATVRLANASTEHDGVVDAYTFAPGAPTTDRDEPDVLGALDLRHAVLRFDETGATLLVALAAPLAVPQLTSLELYVDGDIDGIVDRRIRTGPLSLFQFDGDPERMQVGVSDWDAAAGQALGMERIRPWRGPLPLYSRLVRVRLSLADLGVDGPRELAFYVVHRGLNERWRPGPEADLAPDGADQAGGPRFRTAPQVAGATPLTVPAGGEAELGLSITAAALLVLETNRFEDDGAQFQLLAADPLIPRPALYLPHARR
jgi:hypothetical protein